MYLLLGCCVNCWSVKMKATFFLSGRGNGKRCCVSMVEYAFNPLWQDKSFVLFIYFFLLLGLCICVHVHICTNLCMYACLCVSEKFLRSEVSACYSWFHRTLYVGVIYFCFSAFLFFEIYELPKIFSLCLTLSVFRQNHLLYWRAKGCGSPILHHSLFIQYVAQRMNPHTLC